MKKIKLKYICAIALTCVIIGGVCIGAGIIQGGNLSNLHIGKDNTSWWPFQYKAGINISTDKTHKETWEQSLDNIKGLDIDMDLGNVEVRKGQTSRIQFVNLDKNEVSIKQEHDELEVDVKQKGIINVINASSKIIVTLTQTDFELNVKNNAGDITVTDVVVRDLDLECDLGDINARGITAQTVEIEQKAGDITLEGNIQKTIGIKNHMGDIAAKLNGVLEDYSYEISNKLGDTQIGDQRYELHSDVTYKKQNVKTLEVENSMGDITITFG